MGDNSIDIVMLDIDMGYLVTLGRCQVKRVETLIKSMLPYGGQGGSLASPHTR